jgi:post-segregation antitoxin (ccd killing protein)
MPNRTIYLPAALDAASRRLGLNLSRLTQEAIEREVASRPEVALDAAFEVAEARIAALGITWPMGVVAAGRAEAGER